MRSAKIAGLGIWLPEEVRTNDYWPADFAQSASKRDRVLTDVVSRDDDPHAAIVRRHVAAEEGDPFVGTKQRHVAGARFESRRAEAAAAKSALADAGLDASDVDVLIGYTVTPEQPGMVATHWIAHEIGARRAGCFAVESACASVLVQLRLGHALIASGEADVVLATQSYLMARTMPYRHPASPNVGDAATAFVLRASDRGGVRSVVLTSHGEYHDAVVWARDEDNPAPWWEPGGAFRLQSYDRDTAEQLVSRTVEFGVDSLGQALAKAGKRPSDLDVIATVQPRRWIGAAIAEGLGLPASRSINTFAQLAHVGTCGVVANLIEARRRGLLVPGATVGCYAQGAGFARAAAVLEW